MHEDLQFPIQCSFRQRVYKNYSWKGDALGPGVGEILGQWEAFDRPYLIPSLVRLAKTTTSTKRARKAAMLKWIKRFGLLTLPVKLNGSRVPYHETYSEFWSAAQELAGLWDMYRFVLNRKFRELQKLVHFEEVISAEHWDLFDPVDEETMRKYDLLAPRGAKAKAVFLKDEQHPSNEIKRYTTYWASTVEEIEENPMEYCQYAVFEYIVHQVEQHLAGINLASANRVIIRDTRQDHHNIEPCLIPTSLLQAMYLQFYILLSDRHKRICEACGKLFMPSRKDKKYCSTACNRTAKSRRQRKRKKKANTRERDEESGEKAWKQ